MTREPFTDETFDRADDAWLDERAHRPATRTRCSTLRSARTVPDPPAPGLAPSRAVDPQQLMTRLQPLPRLVPILLLIALLLALPRRSPSPSRARSDACLHPSGSRRRAWSRSSPTATSGRRIPDGSGRVQLTSDPRIDGFPTFSRDGTRIAFKRFQVPNSIPDWQDWGDVMVADADGGHPIVLDAMVHSPSPMTWSAGRPVHRLFADRRRRGSGLHRRDRTARSRHQVTIGSEANWGPTLSPDGRTIAFIRRATRADHRDLRDPDRRHGRAASHDRFDVRIRFRRVVARRTTLLFSATSCRHVDADRAICWLSGWTACRSVASSRPLADDIIPTWSPDGRSSRI